MKLSIYVESILWETFKTIFVNEAYGTKFSHISKKE